MIVRLATRNLKEVRREFALIDKNRVDMAEKAAMDVAKDRLMVLKNEMRAGAPGGRKMAGLSNIGQMVVSSKGLKKRGRGAPLHTLAKWVYVNKFRTNVGNVEINVGFVHKGGSGSNAYINVAAIHQAGQTRHVSEKKRRYFAVVGKTLPERSKFRKFFFIRKATTTFKTPARPIIDPFWAAHGAGIERDIKSKYKQLMMSRK